MTQNISSIIIVVFTSLIYLIPVESNLRSCDQFTNGKTECLFIPGYTDHQYARCSNNKYMKDVTNGTETCALNNNITYYCWYPCQKEKFNKDVGNIDKDCSCGNYVTAVTPVPRVIVAKRKHQQFPEAAVSTNCSFLNNGKKRCLFAMGYTRYQWLRCSNQSYIQQQSRGLYHCGKNESYCWYLCQQEMFRRDEGEIEKLCLCNPTVSRDLDINDISISDSLCTVNNIVLITIATFLVIVAYA